MPDAYMPPALRFMLAARRIELEGLEGLSFTCELVASISQLVHALQRERGYSNLYLGNPSDTHRPPLDRLSDEANAIAEDVSARFERMDLDTHSATDRARLFNRIAYVLHGFEALPRLRRRIRERSLSPLEATAALTRMIGGLLAVVFEAADTAVDPSITRILVALFNFMQGKELAGQERATGVAGFSAGFFDAQLLQRLEQLGHSQDRCFETFSEFADGTALGMWKAQQAAEASQQLLKLRAMAARTSASATVDPSLSELWFDLNTARIDAMKAIEEHLAQVLLQACQASIALARCDLDNHRLLLKRLASLDTMGSNDQAKLFNIQANDLSTAPSDGLGPHLGRSVLDLLHAQTQRLVSANDELETARQALNERKVVERAKKLLMDEYQLSESEAYAKLRQSSMERGQRMVEVAQSLLDQVSAQGAPRHRG